MTLLFGDNRMGNVMVMATAKQAAQLLHSLGDLSRLGLQRLLDNWRILKQIADGNVSPEELSKLAEERYVPLSDFAVDVEIPRWHLLKEAMARHGLHWSQLSVRETDGSYTSFRCVGEPNNAKELIDFLGQTPDKWLIRLPAAY